MEVFFVLRWSNYIKIRHWSDINLFYGLQFMEVFFLCNLCRCNVSSDSCSTCMYCPIKLGLYVSWNRIFLTLISVVIILSKILRQLFQTFCMVVCKQVINFTFFSAWSFDWSLLLFAFLGAITGMLLKIGRCATL